MKRGKKPNKKIVYLVVILVLGIVSAIGGNFDKIIDDEPVYDVESNLSESGFKAHFIDVGQGDCTLIECGGKFMLIDAGENGHETDVLNYLRSTNVEKLDYVIATHQHSDHIGGLPEVLEEFETETIIMPKLTQAQTPTNSTYKAFLNAVKASGAQVISAKVGSVYYLADAKFEILGPVSDDCDGLNSMSAVTKITYGETSFLVTGDAEKDEETEIVENGAELDCDVLKVGHHGSKTSSCEAFLNEVTPKICIISCGKDNDYGHPHNVTVERLKKYTDEIYRTDICGNIVVSSNGTSISVDYENL